MAALLEAIEIKRKMFFELEETPFHCLDVEISTPTARGGQTLVRIKMRNLLTRAVFDKTFKAGDKFKEPDLALAPASYLYSDGDGSHFMDQETYETHTLGESLMGEALDYRASESAENAVREQARSAYRAAAGIVQELHHIAPRQILTVTEPARLDPVVAGTFAVRSWKGMPFEIQAATNLMDWTSVATVTNLDGTLKFEDPNAISHPRRFYRSVAK